MQIIDTREQLIAWARERGLRPDWHEPDEQGITARVEGTAFNLDNAMGTAEWYGPEEEHAELYVVFSEHEFEHGQMVRGRDLAAVNLANLCAWATEPHPQPEVREPVIMVDGKRWRP